MSFTVTDNAVQEFADRICSGRSTSDVFPGKMSDCAFTPEQREIIRAARLKKKAQIKALKVATPAPSVTEPIANNELQPIRSKSPALTKLEKMLYLQGGKCFFCGELLDVSNASIEHLLPISQGGQRIESNEVVCHKTINDAFGAMDLKRKIDFVIRSSGKFRCPQTSKNK